MGSQNSPAAACQFGAGFLQEVMLTDSSFQSTPHLNNFTIVLEGKTVDPKLGSRRVEIGKDSLGTNIVFMHIDNIFIHSPTWKKTAQGLMHLMNTTVWLGLICQLVKTQLSWQWQKYCRFIYDTRNIPTLQISITKFTQAKSLVLYLLGMEGQRLSRLAVASIAGVLQSLVLATLGNIGNNYLQHLYQVVHDGMLLLWCYPLNPFCCGWTSLVGQYRKPPVLQRMPLEPSSTGGTLEGWKWNRIQKGSWTQIELEQNFLPRNVAESVEVT